jgi:hypothetical protein
MEDRIVINPDIFLPEIKRYAINNKPMYQDQCVDLSYDVMEMAQAWFDLKPWELGRPQDYDTMRECRISMKRYIATGLDYNDNTKAYNLIPSFIFRWIAGYLITYIVKLIIDYYWDDLIIAIGIEEF